MEQLGAEVSVLGPDLQEIVEPPMMPGVLGPIVGCRVAEQVHHVWLQGPAHGGESRRGAQVVLDVVEQIIEQIEYVEPATLGRRFGPNAGRVVEGACQGHEVFGQAPNPVG